MLIYAEKTKEITEKQKPQNEKISKNKSQKQLKKTRNYKKNQKKLKNTFNHFLGV